MAENIVSAVSSSAQPPEDLGGENKIPRESPSYVPTLALVNFGVYIALLTPVLVSLALRVQALVGIEQATSTLSLVLAVGAIFALFANPLAGRLSDRTTSRWGMRRPWIICGGIAGFLSLVLVASANSVPLLIVGWCLAQMTLNAVLAAANATLPDQVAPERRGLPSGIVGMATPLGILAGSILVNAFDSDFGRFVAPAAIALVFSILFALTLNDRKLTEKPGRFSVREFFGSFVFDPRKSPDFGWVWLTKFMFMFAYVGVSTFLPYYLIQDFGIPVADVAGTIVLVNVVGVAATVLASFLGGMLSDKLGRRRPILLFSGLVMACGLLLLAFAGSIPAVLIAQGFVGLGAGAFFAVDLALATQVLPSEKDNAKDLGVLNMANALPQSIAPALAIPVMALGGVIGLGDYEAWYIFGALAAAFAGVLIYKVRGVR